MYLPFSRQRRQTGCSQSVDYRGALLLLSSRSDVATTVESTTSDVDELVLVPVTDVAKQDNVGAGVIGSSIPREKW